MSNARELAQIPSTPSGRRNLIINGAMVIDQRNSGSSVTLNSAENKFATDRFAAYGNTTATVTSQRVTDSPDGFENSYKVTVTTAQSGDVAASRLQVFQAIEGYTAAHLQFGTSNAETVTLSFWVKASATGTYGGALVNGAANRSYPYEYTVSSANTWEYKTITVSGDTSGTWATDNTAGLYVMWGLGVGSNYLGTANQWNGAYDIQPTGSKDIRGTLNATWQVTGVQLEVGSVATEFEHRSYGEELALCERYYEIANPLATLASGTYIYGQVISAVAKRAAPTGSLISARYYRPAVFDVTTTSGFTMGSASSLNSNGYYFFNTATGVTSGDATTIYGKVALDAEL